MTRTHTTPGIKSRRAVSALLLAIMALAALLPLQVSAVFGWSLTANPRTLEVDAETDVVMRLTDTDGSGDIACLRIAIPRGVQYRGGRIVATSVDGEWDIKAHNNDPTLVEVFNKKGDAKLIEDDWVEFVVTVRPREVGLAIWTAEVFQGEKCDGDTFLPQILIQFVLLDDGPVPTAIPTLPIPTPTLAPTPTPTRAPTTTPTRAPTPTPTRAPTPTPTRAPTPTAPPASTPTPQPQPTPTPPTQPPAPTLRPTPTPTIPAAATPTPTPVRPPGETSPPEPSPPSSTPSPSASNGAVVPPPSGESPPTDGPGVQGAAPDPPPIFRYEMPPSLYSVFEADAPAFQPSFDSTVALGGPVSWFIPALVTGVPGLLIILLVAANVLIGASWLPTFGRLLGPEPDAPEDDARVWWAAGRPIA